MITSMNSSMNVIYALSLDGESHRYVGMTTKGAEARLCGHLQRARTGSTQLVHRWIRKYGAENIVTVVLETAQNDPALRAAEIRWIAKLRAEGYRLLNMTNGGEGAPFGAGLLRIGFIEPSNDQERDPRSLVSFHNAQVSAILGRLRETE